MILNDLKPRTKGCFLGMLVGMPEASMKRDALRHLAEVSDKEGVVITPVDLDALLVECSTLGENTRREIVDEYRRILVERQSGDAAKIG